MNEHIVVTGMGIITGVGYGKEATLNALRSKHSGIGKMKIRTSADYPVSEVK